MYWSLWMRRASWIRWPQLRVRRVWSRRQPRAAQLSPALRTQQVYDNFLKCLALFNQDIVTRAELIALVEPFLGKFANLYRWFKDYVENKPLNSSILVDQYPTGEGKTNTVGAAAAALNGKNRIYLPPGNNYSLEIDYSSCMQYGASYRDISSYPQPINSNQSELCKQVNSNYAPDKYFYSSIHWSAYYFIFIWI